MNKICARCGAESRDEARICVGCGSSNFKLSSKLRRPPLVVPCPACKRLNRAGALNCIKCGTALVGANAMTAPAPLPAAPTRPVARSAEPDSERQVGESVPLPDWVLEPATPRRSGIWTAATMVAIVVVAAAAWFVLGGDASELDSDMDEPALAGPAPADPPDAPPAVAAQGAATDEAAIAAPAAPATEVSSAPAPLAAGGAAAPAAAEQARARQAREKLDRDARARAAQEQQRIADQERARREEPAAGPQAVVTPPAAPPPVAPAPQAARPVPRQTVGQTCSGRNIFSEQVCQLGECRNPANAGDPICIRFKEIEENNNRRVDR